mmetsp:Transcript_452/g.688  ORF Transcript_452/g.688 Transcript_452/m.688 type:complete len:501 (+) Transcript_452:48-1550(+)
MLVGCSSSSSSSANSAPDSIRKRSAKAHRRQAHIAEVLASFAHEISNLETYRNEDPEIVAAELALLEEELPLTNKLTCAPGGTADRTSSPTASESVGGATSSRGFEDTRRETISAGHSKDLAWDSFRNEHARKSGATVGSSREGRKGILSSSVVQALVYDYAMMKRNIRDYDISLRVATAEAQRLRTEVADMRCACSEMDQLQQALVSELATQTELQKENAKLIASTDALRCAIEEALDADGDIEKEAFIDALINENAMLWSLVHLSQTASKLSSSAIQSPSPSLQNRQSLSSRSRTSSGSTHSNLATPSRASPGSPVRQGESSSPRLKESDLGDVTIEPISANADETGQMPMEALAPKAIAALQGRQGQADGRKVTLPGSGVGSGGLGLQQRFDIDYAELADDKPLTTLDKLDFEDEMSEVSSLVESAILLASPRRNNLTAESHTILNIESQSLLSESELSLSPEAAIAGAVGRVIATGNFVESKTPVGPSGVLDSPKS